MAYAYQEEESIVYGQDMGGQKDLRPPPLLALPPSEKKEPRSQEGREQGLGGMRRVVIFRREVAVVEGKVGKEI